MEMDLETVGYLSGELSGFFAHVAKALAEKSSTGSLPPSLFSSTSSAIVPVTAKPGRKSKKVKSTRAPRAVSAYNQFMREKLAELHNGDPTGPGGKARFEEVTKMWSGMSEEEKRAYTEDFKARVARGEISTVPARVTAEAAAAATSVPEAVVSPPDADGAAPSPKKKKKRKDADEAVDEAFASLPDADAMVAYQASADGAVLGEKKKKKKKKKHLEAAAATEI